MRFHANIPAILCASSINLGLLGAATPLSSQTVNIAGGGPPNGPAPIVISPDAIKEIQLAFFLENLETSFFGAGLTNITAWGTGGYPTDTIQVVSKVTAQEEVHLNSLVDLLMSYNAALIPPCNYSFPVESTKRFFEIAHVITSVGIGATIGITERLAVTDPELVGTFSSILTVESRHDAFFRSIWGEVPNPAPFDTGISDIWAYNLALSFVVPGSCPVEIALPILPILTVTQPAVAPFTNATTPFSINAATHRRTPLRQHEPRCPYTNSTTPYANATSPFTNATVPYTNATAPYANATAPYANDTAPYTNTTGPFTNATAAKLEFTWDPMQASFVTESGEQLLVGWVNQLNVPIYTPLEIINAGVGIADIPQEMSGVAFAVITAQQPDNVNDLALATMAGPVLVSLS